MQQTESQRIAALENQRLGIEPEGVEAPPLPNAYGSMNLICEQRDMGDLLQGVIDNLTNDELLDLIDSAVIRARVNKDTANSVQREVCSTGAWLQDKRSGL